MLDAESVFKKVAQLCPDADEAVMPFCEIAAAIISGKMRADVDASDVRLLTAAASVAYCNYLLMSGVCESDIHSFKAGDITVTKGAGSVADAAVRLRDIALADAAELLCDNDFDFRTV